MEPFSRRVKMPEGNVSRVAVKASNASVQNNFPPEIRHCYRRFLALCSTDIMGKLINFLIYTFKGETEFVPVSLRFENIYI
jgi:hypothetical protein